ncbi:uncharacterized protein [Amphiura filiformis]|uniref:uncharacterized protein isoform X2 n=1 Tax=Amphiura filiformis TaxID=82378 RepID=UPI003B214278
MLITMDELGSSLPDPNKQTFPVLSPQPAAATPGGVVYDYDEATPPPGDMGGHYATGRSAIELPQIYDQSNGGAEDPSNASKDALKPTLPSVPSKQKGVSREGGGRSIQQAIEKIKKSQPGVKEHDFDDVGKDDLTDRIHAPNPLPYQFKSFRSSVQMKTVPLNKRQRDLFAGLTQYKTLPTPLMKSRVLPVHTRPFLWGQNGGTTTNTKTQSPLSLPDKFQAEEQHVKKMRGHKRRYSVPAHRKGFNDLHIGGQVTKLELRDDYRDEMTNLRNTVVPSEIQELYTGKGFKLPASHSSNRKLKEWQENLQAEYALPSSAPATISIPVETAINSDSDSNTVRSHSADGDSTNTKQTVQQSKSKQYSKPSNRGDYHVQGRGKYDKKSEKSKRERSEVRRNGQGKADQKKGKIVPKPKPASKNIEKPDGGALPQLQMESPTKDLDKNNDMEVTEESTNNDRLLEPSVDIMLETPEVILPDEEQTGEDRPLTTGHGRPESEMEIEMTPEDEHANSRLRLPFSPTTPKAVSPNPLKSADLTLNISAERREELAAVFRKLDSDQDGHISMAELQRTLPDTLTRGQQKFIKEVYELVSASTFFGMDEYVTVTCLCEEMLQLPEQLKASYDEVDASMIEQLISQYVILFSTVDRQQTGSISIEALQEILTMAFDKDLKIHTQLYKTMLQTIDKEYSSAISKVEYLTFLPYFFTCK